MYVYLYVYVFACTYVRGRLCDKEKKKEINHWQMTFTLVKSVGQGHNCEENGRREDYYFLFFFL